MAGGEEEGLLEQIARNLTRIVEDTYQHLGPKSALHVLASSRREIERVHTVEQDELAYQWTLTLLDTLETCVHDSAARGLTELMVTAGGRHGSSRQ